MNELSRTNIPADGGKTVRAFGRGPHRGLRLFGVLLSSLFPFTAVLRADDPKPPNYSDSYQQQSLDGSRTPIAPFTSGKRRAANFTLASQFEQLPQKIDFFKLQELQQEEAANRERLQRRIMLPSGALASDLDNADSGPKTVLATAAQPLVGDDFRPLFLGTLLFLAAGVIAFHRFVPGFGGSGRTLVYSWLAMPSGDTRSARSKLSDEEFFSEFQSRFRVDAPAPGARQFAGMSEVDLLKSARECIDRMKKMMQEIRLNTDESVQRKKLRELLKTLRLLVDLASYCQLLPLQQLTSALEPLASQLTEKAENITSSTIRTLTQGVELLAELCRPILKRDLLNTATLRFLVVDDDAFGRQALSVALQRTLNAPDVAENPADGLEMASQQTYDLIFLDVNMPGMDGFELCSKIHETVSNQRTAVVFVTASRDFDTRVKSIASGGKDMISKPFLGFEITVKALTIAARQRLNSRETPAEVSAGRV